MFDGRSLGAVTYEYFIYILVLYSGFSCELLKIKQAKKKTNRENGL